MDKPSTIGNIPERKSILPKPLTPVGHGIGSSALGSKIPAHMTPEEKTNFMRRLEEYRKKKLQAKQDMTKMPSIIPVVVKAKPSVMSMTKSSEKEMPKLEASKVERRETQNNVMREGQNDERKEILKDGVQETSKVERRETQKDQRKEPQKDEKKETLKDQRKETQKVERKEALKNQDVQKVNKQEIKKEEKQVQKVEKKDGKKEEKENVFERLFRKSTRVSMAKTVEKFEPKMEPPPKPTRHSIKPKRPASSSSLKSLTTFKVPEPKPKDNVAEPKSEDEEKVEAEPEPKDDVQIEPEPTPKHDVNMEPEPKPKDEEKVEPERKPKDEEKVEPEPTPKDEEKIEEAKPSDGEEKVSEEEIPEPEIIVEITTEPDPEEKNRMEIDPLENPIETEVKIPAIIVSQTEDDTFIKKIPVSEEKLPNKKPAVKFLSGERPTKKITIQKKSDNKMTKKPLVTNAQKQEKEKKIKLRRSISMIHRKKIGNAESAIHRTVSEHDLSFTEPEIEINKKPVEDEVDEKRSRSKSVSFMTPKAKTPNPSCLRDKLESWLNDRGHSISGYRHLNCFGINSNVNSTPAFQTPRNRFNDTLEQSQYATAPNTPLEDSDKENMTPKTPTPATAIQRIDIKEVEGWLTDLHKLIKELKYPHNRCEEWLAAIRRKCMGCTQLPIYWECLAALEESRGEMNTAIEYYERAIIKGAEVEAVGDSLEQLFDKLIIDQDKVPYSKADRNVDPKNIFKSTIIKFALQQKAVKELGPEIGTKAKQQLYVATPVRRSSRIQTPYKPHVVSSLKTLDPELQNSVEFQTNKFLLTEK